MVFVQWQEPRILYKAIFASITMESLPDFIRLAESLMEHIGIDHSLNVPADVENLAST